MKSASVPVAWLGLGFGWDTRLFIEVAQLCEARGIDTSDLAAVRKVALGIKASRNLLELVERAKVLT